ncbi:MAG TPA: DUF3570 domain-containing protein [Kofleriaceae bacterium]|nr:DUF3570 domain-containing protein [Kofleriaceae bacterium]
MRLQLIVVAAALLAAAPAAAEPNTLSFDTLFYSDNDNVLVVSPQVAAHRALDDAGGEASARVAVDIISAASVDVVSQATSGFTEVRKEAALSGSLRIGELLPAVRYRFSDEPDYRSHGFGVTLSRDFAGHDSTLAVSFDVGLDTVGRTGTAFSAWSRHLNTHTGEVGLTQVLGPRTVIRGSYSLTLQDGYMEKPYRYVPLFDAAVLADLDRAGMTVGGDDFDTYRLPERPPEEVPDRRVRHALSLRALRFIPAIGAAQLDYRFYLDSWGVQAHTVDAAIKIPIGRFRLDVEDRLHYQLAADFWARAYTVDSDGVIPTWRTVDRELGTYAQDTAFVRLQRPFGDFLVYAMGGTMITRYDDFLYLDWRLALVSEAGVRWDW